ncbi:MAG: hypothetical protein Q4G63_03865 [Bacteroidia bacterium]|nr:hypothetical protein [Bacteroidia bacterium]
MTDNNIYKSDDELIRQMMQSAKQQAPENLKYRIMQQIETEKALNPQPLTHKKDRLVTNMLRDFKSIFGVAYLLLFALSVITLLFFGKESLMSSRFIFVAVLISVVSLSLWGITRLDARLRAKRKEKPQS